MPSSSAACAHVHPKLPQRVAIHAESDVIQYWVKLVDAQPHAWSDHFCQISP